jgi:WD40 repeat protein
MAPNSTNFCHYLCYADSLDKGIITVEDIDSQKKVRVIHAHNTPILKLNVDFQGNLLVTVSTNGTMVRVFNLSNGNLIKTFSTETKLQRLCQGENGAYSAAETIICAL